MAYTYVIEDKDKNISFNGKRYRTPCKITITSIIQNNKLKQILKNSKIKNYKCHQTKKIKSQSKKINLNTSDNKIQLNSFIN